MRTSRWSSNTLVTQRTREVRRLGSTVARLKLKGIDGGPHKRWSMWFNSMQREEPYLALTCPESCRDAGVPSGIGTQVLHRSEEHTSELQSLMRISYAVFCLKKKTPKINHSATQLLETTQM